MAMKYSQTVMDHFTNPRNVGEIENPDGIGEVGNPSCGDIMTFTIRVKDDRLDDVKFKTFGCGAAIAVSSMISEMAKGKTLDQAMKINNKDVANELEGLPATKMHCSNLGADALHAAIESYQKSKGKGGGPEKVVFDPEACEADHENGQAHFAGEKKNGLTCRCPYCDIETPADKPFCQACGKELHCK
jgi:nitrogen fixation NifU-like protein